MKNLVDLSYEGGWKLLLDIKWLLILQNIFLFVILIGLAVLLNK